MHPLTILSTLPSAGVGALLALKLFGTEFSIIALIGVILLIGIVKKNAIMMIDFALDAERNKGMSSRDAIFAACLLRFRPIMMTTMAAMFGAIPLAIGFGEGAEMRRPLGISIVGGLLVSQLLTLYTTPVVYLYLDQLSPLVRTQMGGQDRLAAQTCNGNAMNTLPSLRENSRAATNPRSNMTMPPANRIRTALAAFIAVLALLAGCAVGPQYKRPDVEVPMAFKETGDWKLAEPQDGVPRGPWWGIFGDPQLHALEDQVDISNQNLRAAEAQFRAAQAVVRASRAAGFPTVSGRAGASRSGQGNETKSLFTAGVDAGWEIDLWGKVRRTVEAGEANVQASAADLESLRLSTQGTLAQNYFELRVADAQRQLLDETVAGYERSLQLVNNQYNAGLVARGDVIQAETQLKSAQAQAIDAGIQRAQFEHAIALLIGKPASSFSIPKAAIAKTVPPIPPGVPSRLLERRPDIAAAERRMAAANAQIGVAEAAMYPALTLSASAGLQSSTLADLFSLPSRVWSIGPALAASLFDAGLRRAQTDQAIALYDASVANYRQTVLSAFQEVEDNLAAQRLLEQESVVQDAAVAAADQSVQIALNQYRAGTVSYLAVVTAQTIAYTNRRTALDILRRRLVAAATLVKALGGGWTGVLPPP